MSTPSHIVLSLPAGSKDTEDSYHSFVILLLIITIIIKTTVFHSRSLAKADIVIDTPPKPIRDPIPIEIYEQILSSADRRTLIACLRASHHIHRITAPIIYPILYTNLTIDLARRVNPLTIGGVPIDPCARKAASAGIMRFFEPSNSDEEPIPATSPKPPLPNRFAYTTHLTLAAHHRHTCSSLLPLDMPNLITLRVQPDGRHDSLNLCSGPPEVHAMPSPSYAPRPGFPGRGYQLGTSQTYPRRCPLIAHLQPSRVILGDCTTGLINHIDLPSIPYELIVLVGMMTGYERDPRSTSPSTSAQLPYADKVVFVSSCGNDGWGRLREREEDLVHPLEDLEMVARRVIEACNGAAKEIEIIQDYDVDSSGRMDDPDAAQLQAEMRSQLEKKLVGELFGRDASAQKAAAVKFVDDDSFGRRESWYRALREGSVLAAMNKVDQRARELGLLGANVDEEGELEDAYDNYGDDSD